MPLPKINSLGKQIKILDCLDEFSKGALTDEGIYPLTENNRNIVEMSLACNRSYKSNLSNLVHNLNSCYGANEIKKVLKEINRTNSTRLSNAELDFISNKIVANYPDIPSLKTGLNGGQSGVEILFKLIGEALRTKAKNSNKQLNRMHPSFASKFIFYVSKELGCNAHLSFSKYDSIVAERLPAFLNEYGINKQNFTHDSFNKKGLKNIDDIWDMYINKYNKSMNDLTQEAAKVHGYSPTLEEIDHIIWYL